MNHKIILCSVTMLLLAGCNYSQDKEASPPPPTTAATADIPDDTATPTEASAPNEHRIGIRTVDGAAEFYDRETGEVFVPRGHNFHRWIFYDVPGVGPALQDSIFNTEFGQLDQVEPHLKVMEEAGYNTIRIWGNACWSGSPGCLHDPAGGLDEAYLRNIATFLEMAWAHGLYVMFTFDDLPESGGYFDISYADCCEDWDGYNLDYLSAGGVEANRRFWHDFVQGLMDVGAPMDAILAYQLRNEGFFENQLPPLNRDSGIVTAANGKDYDMASDEDKRRMMEDGWLFWTEAMVDEIKSIDPSALVTMGFFVQKEPNPVRVEDPRLVYVGELLHKSSLDFFDFHAYPGFDLNIRQHAENFEMIGYQEKPIVMGEFGAHLSGYPEVETAAVVLQDWQSTSCELGFDGWLQWTWGAAEAQDDFWAAVDGEGAIENALAPTTRPDPCAPVRGSAAIDNIAWSKPASASAYETGPGDPRPPKDAFDLSHNSYWNAGAGPPQWLEVDLEAPHTVEGGELTANFPGVGRFVITVLGSGPSTGGSYIPLHTFDIVNDNPEVMTLAFSLAEPKEGLQQVRVQTSVAPGWVLWHEVSLSGSIE